MRWRTVGSELWKFGSIVLAAAIGAYIQAQWTYRSDRRADLAKRDLDSLMEVYFAPDGTERLDPTDMQIRQSILRQKFAMFADKDTLQQLDRIQAAASCGEPASDKCLDSSAREYLVQREAIIGKDGASEAFLRLMRRELEQQRRLTLPNTTSRFWIVYPKDMDIKGDDIPAVRGRDISGEFSDAFPTSKYVVLLQLYLSPDRVPRLGDGTVCMATIGVTPQPVVGARPVVPKYTISGAVFVPRRDHTSNKDCLIAAADEVIPAFFKIPVATLKQNLL